MNKKILYQPWGGLGDNLQFSTLPEQFHKMGIDFYVHKYNAVRNKEIYDLVWGLNPYVKGVSDENYNCVPIDNKSHLELEYINRIEVLNGAEPSEIPYPKIYYKPNFLDEFSGKTVVSINSISLHYSEEQINNILSNLSGDCVFLAFEKNLTEKCQENTYNHHVYLKNQKQHIVKSIFEHVDIIFSCKKFICLQSGAASLASAVKYTGDTPEVLVYIKEEARESFEKENSFNFKNLNYKFI